VGIERGASPNVVHHEGRLTREQRRVAFGFTGVTVLFTGLSASGKSTIASGVEESLVRCHRPAFLLDGDNLRHGLSGDLGFTEADRQENVRRAGHVARMFAESGTVALLALISPYAADRHFIRALHEEDGLPFIEVFLNTPLEVCEERDPKGLYARARAGELTGFTGIDSDYEPPDHADLVLHPAAGTINEQVELVMDLIARTSG
jgi:bifunctional enzyme CysN/CysC